MIFKSITPRKFFVTVRAGEHSIALVYVDVLLQTGHLGKLLPTYRAVVQSPWVGVGLDVAGQGTVGEEPLAAVLALQRLRLVPSVHRHVLLQSAGEDSFRNVFNVI